MKFSRHRGRELEIAGGSGNMPLPSHDAKIIPKTYGFKDVKSAEAGI